MGTRFALTALSAFATPTLITVIGWLSLIPVLGWAYIIFIGERNTGAEVFGDKIWWGKLRPVHMMLWLTFAVMAIQKMERAWLVLLADTLFGLVAFLVFHGSQGNLAILYE
jgi:hypothetical protein